MIDIPPEFDSSKGPWIAVRPSLSLCMIVRDVAPYIGQCLSSILPYVRELCVVDTGSQDETIAVIQELVDMMEEETSLKIAYFNPETHPEGFILDSPETFSDDVPPLPRQVGYTGKLLLADYGKARQISFDMATSDYVMWIDSDDVVENPHMIGHIIRAMQAGKIDSAVLPYLYEEDEQGRITCYLMRTRIVRREGPAKWNQPIHENLGPLGNAQLFNEQPCPVIRHFAKEIEKIAVHRPPLRNYKILSWHKTKSEREGAQVHPRILYYLGNEARQFDPHLALRLLSEYIEKGDWDEERALAHIYCAQIHEGQGRLEEARAHYAAASAAFNKPEAHFGLARSSYYLGDWKEAIRHHENGRRAIRDGLDVLSYNPLDREYLPALIAARSYMNLGQLKKAALTASRGLELVPTDLHLQSIMSVADRLLKKRERTLTIAIHTAGSLEPWGPETPYTTGIGGSETAAVHIARTLSLYGHDVRLYCECQRHEGVHDGVTYRHHSHFQKDAIGCMWDVFISSRRPATFIENQIDAKLKVLWMHDNHVGAPRFATAKGLLATDLVLTVSSWHRDYVMARYPFLNPEKIVATRNGIDEQLYREPLPPKKNKLIYSSSSDRGLVTALALFPQVRKEVPDAELHVFYGFDTIDKMIEQGFFSEDEGAKIRGQIQAIREKAEAIPGVHLRGRVGQRQLAEEMREAKALFYPTDFMESSCITAMEAQAAGCLPITTALAALTETVHHGFLLHPPATSDVYQNAFIRRAIWCLREENNEARAQLANEARENSLQHHAWSGVAKEWTDLFCELLASPNTR